MDEKKFTIQKGKKRLVDGKEIDDITPINMVILSPRGDEPIQVKESDVWGKWNENRTQKLSQGMIVARSGDICPHFGDEVPYKSVTVVCNKKDVDEVTYWLDYVQGTDSVVGIKDIIEDKKVAIRSDYQAW